MTLDVRLLPVLKDNYCYLLRDAASGLVAVVDPAEAQPVLSALDAAGWKLDRIINTHHHYDHTGGNAALAAATGALVEGPAAEAAKIPALGRGLKDGDVVTLGATNFTVMETHGHTNGHITLYSADAGVAFTGDTLFALGCGRVFEGTAADMWQSMKRLRALPPETKIYCGHEYTQANCRFALSVEPANAALQARSVEIDRLRAAGLPTIPSSVALERETNPFLRADVPSFQQALSMVGSDPVAVFAETRGRKDRF